MEAIPLTAMIPGGFDPTACKVHFAVWNQVKHPIDVLATNREEWQGWNSWRSVKNDFNREFIFSVAQDKHDPTRWIFGGDPGRSWSDRPEQQSHSYTVALREDLMGPFIRRLFIRHSGPARNIRRTMESQCYPR